MTTVRAQPAIDRLVDHDPDVLGAIAVHHHAPAQYAPGLATTLAEGFGLAFADEDSALVIVIETDNGARTKLTMYRYTNEVITHRLLLALRVCEVSHPMLHQGACHVHP